MNYAATSRTILQFRTSVLDLDIGDYSGELLDMSFGVDWFFSENFAVGGGIMSTDISVVRDGGEQPGHLLRVRGVGLGF